MNHCHCGELKDLVFVEGSYYCNNCLSMDEEILDEQTGSLDQQFQGFEEEIFEKVPMSKDMKQVPTASTKAHLSEGSTARGVPTITWTSDQVENWAMSVGGEASAKILKDQEITGNDLLTNNYNQADLERWGIKGGPAGRIISALTKITSPKKVLPVVSMQQLGVSDFLPFDLPQIEPQTEPKIFIRKDWLTSQIQIINKYFNAKDGISLDTRLPPMALVAHSGAGKTRALLELSKALQQEYKVPVIFISFNASTGYNPNETVHPLDSLLSRIAYAVAKPSSTQNRKLHNVNNKLQFASSVTEITEWLNDKPCILCIDELNILMPSEQVNNSKMKEVALFLKEHFLSPARRYFIFTTHVYTTTLKLTSYMHSSSDRLVYVAGLPVFESISEVSSVLQNRTLIHPMIYGNSPGLAYVCQANPHYPSVRVQHALSNLITASGPLLVYNLFSGKCDCLNELDTLTRVSAGTRIWIPAFLKELFTVDKLTNLDRNYKILAVNMFDSLGRAKLDSGEAWEVVVLCTLFFRILSCTLNLQSNSDLITYSGWLPPLPSLGFTIDVQYPHHDLESVLSTLSNAGSSPSVILSYPKQSAFPIYDILVAVTYSPTEPVAIWGYQCKAGDLPKSSPHSSVSVSIVLRSHDIDSHTSSASKSGWKIAGKEARSALLGPTFFPLRLLERPGGSAIKLEEDVNTMKRHGEQVERDDPAKKQNTKK